MITACLNCFKPMESAKRYTVCAYCQALIRIIGRFYRP